MQACKVQGGQTRFIEEAIENYVKQLDMMEKLNTIENLLRQLVGSGQEVQPVASVSESKVESHTEIQESPKDEPQQAKDDAQKEQPDILDPSQREAAYSTLRAILGGDDI